VFVEKSATRKLSNPTAHTGLLEDRRFMLGMGFFISSFDTVHMSVHGDSQLSTTRSSSSNDFMRLLGLSIVPVVGRVDAPRSAVVLC